VRICDRPGRQVQKLPIAGRAGFGDSAAMHFVAPILAGMLSVTPAADAVPYPRFRISGADLDRLEDPAYRRCTAAVDTGSADYLHQELACIAAETRRLDNLLNATFRAALARLPDRPSRLRLRTLERRWLVTRFDFCHGQRGIGGEFDWAGQVMFGSCAIGELRGRIAWLHHYGRRP